jgi:hypothetical protein
MPWEHYKGGRKIEETLNHPAFKGINDRHYKNALNAAKEQFSGKVVKSELFCINGKFAWKFGYTKELAEVRNVGEYGNSEAASKEGENVRFLLTLLRNAFSHNNICAFGSTGNIERLSFFSEDIRWDENGKKQRLGWHVATTTVDGLEHFLQGWFSLINDKESRRAVSEVLLLEEYRAAA